MTDVSHNIEEVGKTVKEEISKITGVDFAEIDENLTLEDYFFDSIKVASLVERLGRKFQTKIELIDVYNSGNIKNAILYLAETLKDS